MSRFQVWVGVLILMAVAGSGPLGQSGPGDGGRESDELRRLRAARETVESDPREAQAEAERVLTQLGADRVAERAEAWVVIGLAHTHRGAHDEARRWIGQALELARQQEAIEQELTARYALIMVHRNMGDLEREIELGRESLALAQQVGERQHTLVLANALGASLTRKGLFDQAIASFHLAYDIARASGDLEHQTKMLNNLSSLLISTRQFESALEYLDQALELADRQGNPGNTAVLLTNRAYLLEELGRGDEQRESLERALELARRSGLSRVEGGILLNLADYHLKAGRYVLARDLARQGLRLAEQVGDRYQSLVGRVTYGQAIDRLGRHPEAQALFQEARSGFQAAGMEAEVIEVTRIIAAAHEAAGEYRSALEQYKQYKERSDAFFQSERQKTVTELQEKFESEQKQREIELLSKDNELKSRDLERKMAQRNIVLLVAVSLLLVCLLVFQRYRHSRKTNARLSELNEKLNELSLKDTLTGLYNRRYFFSHIDTHVAYARRKADDIRPTTGRLAFLIIDIDHFKAINDTLGHHVGDLVLQEFGVRLNTVLRQSDILVRWGGEEFLLVARDASDETVGTLAERVLRTVDQSPFAIEGRQLPVTCSVGYCWYPFVGGEVEVVTWEKAIQLADKCLYKAKIGGRNRAVGIRAARDGMTAEDQRAILTHFDQAVAEGSVQLL